MDSSGSPVYAPWHEILTDDRLRSLAAFGTLAGMVRPNAALLPLFLLPLLALGCGEDAAPPPQGPPPEVTPGTPIPADAQRPGDAVAGYAALVNEGYVTCGLPD